MMDIHHIVGILATTNSGIADITWHTTYLVYICRDLTTKSWWFHQQDMVTQVYGDTTGRNIMSWLNLGVLICVSHEDTYQPAIAS